MSTAILVRDDANLKISFSPEAERLKEDALTFAALIGKVTNPAENETAVGAQTALKTIISTVEKARTEAKAPVLDYGRAIDTAARGFVEELQEELTRVSGLVGDFAMLEQAKVRAAEAARKLDKETLERQRQEAIAQAPSHESLDAINEHYDRLAADLPVVTAVRAEGQIIKSDWLIEVTDIWLLARTQRTCVDIKPRISEIKELLKLGVHVEGIKATQIVSANVRAGTPRKAIEV
jgi:hypothetical protein